MNRVIICGYYGFDNIGDEAILSSIISDLRKIEPDIDISVLTYNADKTKKNFNVKTISRSKFIDIIKNIKNSDLLLYGGGSLLQDVTSSKSLLFYLGLIILAKLFGKKVMFYCNGYGPVNKKTNRFLIKKIVSKVDLITLRDIESKKQLEKLGISKNVKVTADAAFTMDSVNKERIKEIFEVEGIPMDKKMIGISVRRWKNNNMIVDVISKTIDYFSNNNSNVVLIPMKYPDDLEFSLEIMEKCKSKPYIVKNHYTPQEVLGIIGELDLMVSIRLHSLIFAAIKGVPMVGIEYDPKVKSFLKLVEQKSAGKIEKLDLTNLCICIEEVLNSRDRYIDKLNNKIIDLKDKVLLTSKLTIELLKK